MTPMPYGAAAGEMPAPPSMMPPQMPPMPTPEQLEEDKLIAEACSWEEISGVLHSDDRRNYTVDIETDATAFEDAEVEKTQRIEYLKAMTEMLQAWIPAIQANPTLAPFAKELAIFGSGAFKPGRQFEEQLGDAFDQIQNMPPQPNPEAEKLKAEAEREQRKFAMEARAKQQEAAAKERDRQQEAAFREKDYALKERGQMAELAFKEKEFQFKEAELGLKMQDQQMNRVMAAEKANADREAREEDRAVRAQDRQAQREQSEYDRGMREREFGMKEREIEHKREDMAEKRAMAGEKAEERHTALRGEVDGAFQAFAKQVQAALEEIIGQQREIAAQQAEATDAITAIVSHMIAPRKVKRDEAGRAVGVEIGQGEAKALKDMLSGLKSGGRSITRDPKTNRIEAFT